MKELFEGINLNQKIKYFINAFALISFISIAAGNILLGISTLLFFLYAYNNKNKDFYFVKEYFYVIGIFVFMLFISAVFSGDLAKGIKVWLDMWIWRCMPFVIIVCSIKEINAIKKILKFAFLGITIGAVCLIYQGLSGDSRAAGFFGNPMTFAGYLCIYMPILLIDFFERKIFGKYYWYSGIAFLLCCIALIFNATRGAWIAIAIVSLLIVFFYMSKSKSNFIIGILVVGLCTVGILNNDKIMNRLSTITNLNYQSNSERFLIWDSSLNMFKDYPVFGVGLGQYKDNYQKKYISPKAINPNLTHAHNNILQMLAENGVVGFIGFIVMFGYIIWKNSILFLKNRNPYSLMIVCSTIALLLQGFTEYNLGNSAVIKSYWLVLGCLVAIQEYLSKSENILLEK